MSKRYVFSAAGEVVVDLAGDVAFGRVHVPLAKEGAAASTQLAFEWTTTAAPLATADRGPAGGNWVQVVANSLGSTNPALSPRVSESRPD